MFSMPFTANKCHTEAPSLALSRIRASSALSKSFAKHCTHRQHQISFVRLHHTAYYINDAWYHDVRRRFTHELIFRTLIALAEDYIMFELISNKSIFLLKKEFKNWAFMFSQIRTISCHNASIQQMFQQYNPLDFPFVASLKCHIYLQQQYRRGKKSKISALKMCFILNSVLRFFFLRSCIRLAALDLGKRLQNMCMAYWHEHSESTMFKWLY